MLRIIETWQRRVASGGLAMLTLCGGCAGPRCRQDASKAEEIAEFLAGLEERGEFSGVVLVAEKGKLIFRRAYGFSEFERGVRMRPEAAFEIASISKTFTAVAIHMLVERGRLSLDDRLSSFFPNLPYDEVRIRGLLSHTSGLYDIHDEVERRKRFLQFYGRTDRPYGNKDYLAFLERFKPELAYSPGQRMHYSNTAYVLLALIVEKVSGQAFDEFLRQNIFQPAGMQHTVVYSLLVDRRVPGLATGYRRDPEAGVVREPDPKALGVIRGLSYGDDEIVSTVDDLLAYDRALRAGKLLKPETMAEAMIPQALKGGGRSDFGLGFRIAEEAGRKYVFHAGGTEGFRSYCKFSRPENDSSIIIFTNLETDRAAFRAIHARLRQILRRPRGEYSL